MVSVGERPVIVPKIIPMRRKIRSSISIAKAGFKN
jgi:hypothetical protein